MRQESTSSPRRRRSQHSESGAAMVLFALTLVVLMLFAALAVDVGSGYAQRRRNQSAADTAALAAGQKFLVTGSYSQAVQAAKDVLGENLASPPTALQWEACTDSKALSLSSVTMSPSNGTPCISFGTGTLFGMMQVRVRVPTVSQPTVFAGIVGIKSIKSSAVAVAQFGSPTGGALPVYVLSGLQAGDMICLINAPGGQDVSCAGQSSGNFGGYAPYYYLQQGCPDGGNSSQKGDYQTPAPALALGLDHLLTPYPVDPTTDGGAQARLNGGSNCTVLGANTVSIKKLTGNWNQLIDQGLVSGYTSGNISYVGRLKGGPFSGGGPSSNLNTATIDNNQIDNAPLWYFLLSTVKGNNTFPLTCQQAANLSPKRDLALKQLPSGYSTPEDLMAACFQAWSPSDGPLFAESIGTTHRLGTVPRFWESNATSIAHIRDFVPVYIDAEYGGTGHTTTHMAGDTTTAWGKNTSMIAEGGMLLPCLSLPGDICKNISSGSDGLGGVLGGVTLSQ